MSFFTVCFYTYFLFTAVLGACIATAVSFACADPGRSGVHALICRWAYHYLKLNPHWRIVWKGREYLSDPGPYIIVANHQSAIDPFVLSGLDMDFKWMVKQWVFDLPVIGGVLKRAKYVCVDAKDSARALETCMFWLRQGKSVFIFPEGTRSADGELQEFHSGAFRLAAVSGVRILPIVIDGSHEILPKYSRRLAPSGRVEVRILPPLHGADYGQNPARLRARVRQLMQAELTDIRSTGNRNAARPA